MKITIFNIFLKILSLGLNFIFFVKTITCHLLLYITVYSGILAVNASLPVNAHLIFLQYNRGQGQMLLYVN